MAGTLVEQYHAIAELVVQQGDLHGQVVSQLLGLSGRARARESKQYIHLETGLGHRH